VALALKEVPELNSVWRGNEPVLRPAVHVGVAISLRGGGLVAPALHDTAGQGLGDLMRQLRDLVQRARSGEPVSSPTHHRAASAGRGGGRRDLPAQVFIVGFGRSLSGMVVGRGDGPAPHRRSPPIIAW
jgi:pyruvate dehydrogenase E2 component (dihydrolipoamide acetyltransferase)